MSSGRVILVGAGPGDPSLITLRGADLLSKADVVVYDRLAGPELLTRARPDAELIDVGKSPDGDAGSQPDIIRILVEKARAGKTVVRLKGGDPFVFGRGGEEALALLEAGIPFEVVPGVTAGIAAPASAGIPVTHRGLASCVTFVTGHEDPAKAAGSIRWDSLASSGATLVFYMGVRRLPEIVSRLVAAGLPAETPAACIERGATPSQRSIRGTLADIAHKAAKAGIQPPAVTVVGAVAGLTAHLNWFEKRPLFGKRVVNTRPAGQALGLTTDLQELGAQVISLPTIEIVKPVSWREVDATLEGLDRFDWVIFTSASAVEILMDRLAELGRDARAFGRAKVASLGPATGDALRRRAIRPDLVPTRFTAAALLAALKEQPPLKGKRVLLPRSDIARKELSHGLAALGARITEVSLYLTRTNASPPPQAVEAVRRGECDVVTFTSSSTVKGFLDIVGREAVDALRESVRFASIGPVTTATARELGIPVSVEASEHTAQGLVKAILDSAPGVC
jgi:uroporphyrinogen III methyltransferase/synthase